MNAVIYARYSSDNQREESIEGQLRECSAYCEKHDIKIVGNYIDRAFSAKTDDRPEFLKMIKDSEKKQFELVVVWKLDRFSRNRADSAKYKTILGINGVKVVSATENISTGAEGILLESVLEGLAEYYSADLAEKVIRGQTENALKGKFNGGTVPLGYRVSAEQKLEINPDELPLVLEIFKRYDSGDSIKSIVDDFTRRGIKNRNGRDYYINTIGNVLRNRRYIGEYKYRDIVIPNGIPAIIDEKTFERVQKRMTANRHAPAKTKATEEYLLTTKLFCGTCRRMMVGESGKSRNGTIHYYYKCSGNKKYKDCNRKAIKKHWIEDTVIEQTRKNILEDDNVIERIAEDIMDIQNKEHVILSTLKAQLAECDKKIHNLVNAIEEGLYNEHTKARMQELDDQRGKLIINIAEEEVKTPQFTKEDIISWIKQFQKGNSNSMRYRKRLIDIFVNAVYVYDDRIVFTYNYKSDSETVSMKDIEDSLGSDFEEITPPEKSTAKAVLFSMMFALRANDVGFANDVRFTRMMCPAGHEGQTSHHCDRREQHHFGSSRNIISRQRRRHHLMFQWVQIHPSKTQIHFFSYIRFAGDIALRAVKNASNYPCRTKSIPPIFVSRRSFKSVGFLILRFGYFNQTQFTPVHKNAARVILTAV